MQKGIATLEIVLVIFIVAVLVGCAVPNAVRVVDRFSLDYETKRLYSDLRFLQSISRPTKISTAPMGVSFSDLKLSPEIFLVINTPANGIHSWQIVRGLNDNDKLVREVHNLSNGVKISFRNSTLVRIKCDYEGKFKLDGVNSNSDEETTLVLKSRLGKKLKIVFDSVGRMRGGK